MNAVEFLARLARDLKTDSSGNLSAIQIQEVQDAANHALQILHDIAPVHSKKARASVTFFEPKTISLSVTKDSYDFTGWTPSGDDLFCSIVIDGDESRNEIIGTGSLLLPYLGTTGTKTATVYHDAAAIPNTYAEIVLPLVDMDGDPLPVASPERDKKTGDPDWMWVEDNASSQLTEYGSVILLNTLPGRTIRYTFDAILAPIRMNLRDFTNSTVAIPLRAEHIESRLLPVTRGLLAGTDIWRNDNTRARAMTMMDYALESYRAVPQYQYTPINTVGTPCGF